MSMKTKLFINSILGSDLYTIVYSMDRVIQANGEKSLMLDECNI
ncbi:hypothetical protein PanWU01x14_255810 [Parasponia andersonii]|uniref:Uncharacterized protein n=1 Tax=Parasponia andersonii TaxID=3476 RepID=A0A2P5BAU1_PARAD|nr:hypothetical protein PanWU01x14_255810 [Parasponia andersonii]